MSYSVYLYNPLVREEVERGQDIDAFAHPQINRDAVAEFLVGLEQCGYSLQLKNAERQVFKKSIGDAVVEVDVYDTEIGFSVASGDKEAIFEALQDASELCDAEHMVLYDPQAGGWQKLVI
ncbi:MAG TPA: hypothetical protein VK629_20515 [Steroidobacteraceae bacterium]|nr:hypothetical protein [Steroidobacteraceae bacterium]